MAYSEILRSITLPAGAALSGGQYKFVAISSSGNVGLSTSGGIVHGVLYNDPQIGEAATVVVAGVAKVVAGGAITCGGLVASDSGGAAQAAATAGLFAGTALHTVTGAGSILSVLLMPTRNAVTG